MPTIQQLPPAGSVDPADEIPISQSGTTRSVIVGDLLASTQPAISVPTGTLLGRNSVGPGGPESVDIGSGLVLSGGTLSAVAGSLGTAPQVATIATTDLVYISQEGQSHTISYADLIDGETIDAAQPAAAGSDTDTFWVAQGSSTMVRQTFSAVWDYLGTKLSTYKLPIVELTTNTTLDGTVHNGRVLVCSQAVTLTPIFTNMGSGFECDVINLSAGDVTLAPGIITSSGATTLLPGQSASLRGLTYSGGNVIYASISGVSSGGTAPAAPGQVTGLAAGSITATSIGLSWNAPNSGGSPASYSVQFRVSGSGTWTTASSSVSSTAFSVNGLTAGTSYDFEVFAVNAGGVGTPSSTISASTSSSASSVVSITWNLAAAGNYTAGNGTIGVNVHVNPGTAAVQFGFSTSTTIPPSSWTAAAHVNTDLWGAYVPTPATAGTWYNWCEGTDGSAPTVYPSSFTVS